MSDEVLEVQQRTFPKSVQPGLPRLQSPKPGWNTYRFGELLKAVQRPVKLRSDEAYDLVTVKRSRGGIEARGKLRGSQISVKSQFRIEKDDFLISKRQIVHGACGVVTAAFDGSIVSNEYSVLLCKPSLDLNFLGYLTHSVYFQQTCFHSSIGVHIEKMIFKLDDWLKWPINIPSRPEQQKIAAFLGAVDAKLAALAAKQAALGRFKVGLMQKLFSQQLRFTQAGGKAFPDWEEKRLGDICSNFRSGIGITSGQIFETGTYPVYGGNGLRGYCSEFTHDGNFILIGRQGALCGNINWANGRSYISEHAIAVSSNNLSRIEWLFYRLGYLKLNRLSESSAQPGLSVEKLKRLKLNAPHPDEQQRIADSLSAMDAKIQAVADQVTKLQTFKKGLLQQMFV